jgi:hypothetical protein
VLGWTVEDSQPDRARIAVEGWLGIGANLVLLIEPSAVTFSTLIEYRHTAGRVMWFFVRPLHVGIVRLLLWRAVSLPSV